MREIKFRAWNKNYPGMMDWSEIGKLMHVKYFDEWIEEDSIILMQYTGLKDKNGVEIYEGDIIKDEVRKEVVSWDNENTGFLPFIYWLSDEPPWFDLENNEVIGNIYENPEIDIP